MTEDRLQQRLSQYAEVQDEEQLAAAAEEDRNRTIMLANLRTRIDDAIVKARYEKKRTAYLAVNGRCDAWMRDLATEYADADITINYSWWNWISPPPTSSGYIAERWWVISW